MFIVHTVQRDTNLLSEMNANPAPIGPDGYSMTIHDLPPRDTTRWVTRRKAQVVYAVQAGLITLKVACERYNLTPEEFASWQTMIKKHGLGGLRVTRLAQYRKSDKARLSNKPKLDFRTSAYNDYTNWSAGQDGRIYTS